VRIFFDFRSQTRDVIVDGAGCGKGGVAPDDVEESFAGDGFTGCLGHQTKHREFLNGQVKFLASSPGGLADEVDFGVTEFELRRGTSLALDTAQQSPHPGEQFLGTKGFDEVIISADVESHYTVLDLAFGGKHQNGDVDREASQLGANGV